MADVVKVTLNNDTLIDISDSTITPETVLQNYVGYEGDGDRLIGTLTAGGSDMVYYGTNSQYSGTLRTVTTTNNDFALETGAVVIVKFSYTASFLPNSQAYNMNVDGTGNIPVVCGRGNGYGHVAGEVVPFVYDGTSFVALKEETTRVVTTSIASGNTSAQITFYPLKSDLNLKVDAWILQDNVYNSFTDFYWNLGSGNDPLNMDMSSASTKLVYLKLNSAQSNTVYFRIGGNISNTQGM